MMKYFQMENTDRCQALNNHKGEMQLTDHLIPRRLKGETCLFYPIFVLPKFTLHITVEGPKDNQFGAIFIQKNICLFGITMKPLE